MHSRQLLICIKHFVLKLWEKKWENSNKRWRSFMRRDRYTEGVEGKLWRRGSPQPTVGSGAKSKPKLNLV